jgi:hypothetical protein
MLALPLAHGAEVRRACEATAEGGLAQDLDQRHVVLVAPDLHQRDVPREDACRLVADGERVEGVGRDVAQRAVVTTISGNVAGTSAPGAPPLLRRSGPGRWPSNRARRSAHSFPAQLWCRHVKSSMPEARRITQASPRQCSGLNGQVTSSTVPPFIQGFSRLIATPCAVSHARTSKSPRPCARRPVRGGSAGRSAARRSRTATGMGWITDPHAAARIDAGAPPSRRPSRPRSRRAFTMRAAL